MDAVSAQDHYLGRVHGVVISLDEILTPDEAGHVTRLIEHGERVEALVELAWIIVNGTKRIPVEAYRDILELTSGFASAAFLPENLSDHVIASTP